MSKIGKVVICIFCTLLFLLYIIAENHQRVEVARGKWKTEMLTRNGYPPIEEPGFCFYCTYIKPLIEKNNMAKDYNNIYKTDSTSMLFNEITLYYDGEYAVDVDFDGELDKVVVDKGDVSVYIDEKDVSLEIPFCWFRAHRCCPPHNAYTTINYSMHSVFVEAHYGCCDKLKKQFVKNDNTWMEIYPLKPFSIINESLFPVSVFCRDYYSLTGWRLLYHF